MLDGCRLSPAQKEIMKIFLPDEDVNNYKSGIIDENTVTEKELNAFGNCNELDFKTKFNIYGSTGFPVDTNQVLHRKKV